MKSFRIVALALGFGAWLGCLPAGAAVSWVGGGADQNWSNGANWSGGAPANNAVVFENTAAASSAGIVTNLVDTSVSISSLSYVQSSERNASGTHTNPNYYHTTHIGAGQTLTVDGNLIFGSDVGYITGGTRYGPAWSHTHVTIRGALPGDGTLAVNAPAGLLAIDPGPPYWYTPPHTITADLQNLGTLTVATGTVNVARAGAVTATLNLAQNNTITADKLSMGMWNSHGHLNLGPANALNIDNILVMAETSVPAGAQFNNATGTLRFRPGLTGATLTLRGKAGGTSRANMTVGVGGATNTANTGTVNLDTSGGAVDVLLDSLVLGVGGSARAGYGTFQFNSGTIDANSAVIGRTVATANVDGGSAFGTLTIGGSGAFTATTLTLGDAPHAGKTATATVNLSGGTLRATSIQGGADTGTGVRTFNFNSGIIGNKAGADLTIAAEVPLVLKTTATHTFDAETGRTITVHSAISEDGAAGSITKTGGGTLLLRGANTYTGQTTVAQGTLKLGRHNALGTTAGKTVVESGATLDIAGYTAGAEPIEVSGAGVGGVGALFNSGGGQASAFSNVTLLGDTALGANVRWDIRTGTLNMGGHRITKVGNGLVGIVNTAVSNRADIDINAGTFRIEGSTSFNAATPITIQVAANATLDYWASNLTHNHNTVLSGARIMVSDGNTPALSGTLTLNAGSNTVRIDRRSPTLTVTGQVTGDGGFAFQGHNIFQNNEYLGTLALANPGNDYAGNTTITTGILRLGAADVIPDGPGKGNVILNAGSLAGTLDLNGFDETVNGLSGTAGAVVGQVVNNASGTSSVLTVGGNNATSTFAGLLRDNTGSGGTLALRKIGDGTLTLANANTYTGSTTVDAGRLHVTGLLGNNGSAHVRVASAGTTFGANDPTIVRAVAPGGSFAELGSQVTGSGTLATTADLQAGANSVGELHLGMAWRRQAANEPTPFGFIGLVSDVLDLTGMVKNGDMHGETDPFVLTMSYEPALLNGREAELAATGNLYLAWLDPVEGWHNAVMGNFGGMSTYAGVGPWTDFVNAGDLPSHLGTWGVDAANQLAWAVLDHNSQFAVMGVPEPSTLVLGCLALFGLLIGPRRRNRR